ncbi:MAG: UDP-N-acetylmuramoyl-L-alanyl-D-glutamate--2,6-diaminopimelate ligase [Eubacterium sp.]|nr:UDP-N-acetylmuramoyl-L-alanyl-D-glutamate--2,6-diaminopimelate ligase [Eubacterium sp.]
MILKELLTKFDYDVVQGSDECEIAALKYDSRKIETGDVFVCIKGAGFDGHDFASEVAQDGAHAIIVQDDVTVPEDVTVIKVDNTRYALACMSANYFKDPAKELVTIGITGTKGKTTTTYMVKSVLENVGIKTGLIGTIETIIGDEVYKAENTTPESYLIQEYFRKMVDAGCKCVIMEVSSQGLMLDRTSGFKFDYGIFTNIEPDHIGPNEHKDFEDYMECKSKLFRQCKHGIINMDAEHLGHILADHTCDIETYGIKGKYDFTATNIEFFQKPGKLCVKYDLKGKLEMPVELNIPGEFSVYNSLCAIAICSHFTDDTDKIEQAIINIFVKGRVEFINVSDKFAFMIDYAHNAMSLETLLNTLKKYEPKRLVTIFGCGGNRSKDRRYNMGEVSSKLSDLTIVTSDNPRYENPMDIIDDIVVGVEKADGEYVTVPDRKEAIKYAILNAKDGDVIVLAGKGHEDYQEINGVKHPMDERTLISEVMADDEVKAVL